MEKQGSLTGLKRINPLDSCKARCVRESRPPLPPLDCRIFLPTTWYYLP